MPRAVSSEAKQETWRDWMPPGMPEPTELMTRDQLIAQLHGLGIKVTTDQLRFWERQGIVPHPIRRRYEGATRALYPPWEIDFVRALQELRAEKQSLEQIGRRIREIWDRTMEPDPETGERDTPDRFLDFLAFSLLEPHFETFRKRYRKFGGHPVHRLVLIVHAGSENEFEINHFSKQFSYRESL